ncbi:hypothetical protein CHH28_13330 [Bacterioplanes sanyensis]|uniref:Uncharacterized protein n=1 Tax=Bacterioplanes sanyensis TaxID=1249553 RepID=A0A222FLP9_9GAMM|nr:hypothetical protein [Bacterioplanes sanyensis]ASP39592.1 hypothetical protein CHH28_13330 [Bacterioplanes sanyensis]
MSSNNILQNIMTKNIDRNKNRETCSINANFMNGIDGSEKSELDSELEEYATEALSWLKPSQTMSIPRAINIIVLGANQKNILPKSVMSQATDYVQNAPFEVKLYNYQDTQGLLLMLCKELAHIAQLLKLSLNLSNAAKPGQWSKDSSFFVDTTTWLSHSPNWSKEAEMIGKALYEHMSIKRPDTATAIELYTALLTGSLGSKSPRSAA